MEIKVVDDDCQSIYECLYHIVEDSQLQRFLRAAKSAIEGPPYQCRSNAQEKSCKLSTRGVYQHMLQFLPITLRGSFPSIVNRHPREQTQVRAFNEDL
jgi:hypothetical protein